MAAGRQGSPQMSIHGGDVWQAAEDLGVPASELLDFSANINPRGLPPGARARLARDACDAQLLGAYPDPSARRLRRALSDRFAVDADAITIGPGAESLIAPILRSLDARRALVPVPAFSEYRRVCTQLRIEFVPFPLARSDCFRIVPECLSKRMETGVCDAAVLNNPHNPSGAALDLNAVHRIADAAGDSGTALLADEAFIDYAPDASLIQFAAGRPGLVVLRSLTKFYGCPALRIGYAVCHPETARRIQALLPTWPVTQLAIDALSEAVADRDYTEASIGENARERERLAELFRSLGVFVFPSAANYLLLELTPDMPPAADLRSRLLRRHRILIRNCDSYEELALGRYVRVAVRSAEQNCRLMQALSDELRSR